MRGKATLTLCDAKTGKVVKRMEESNMVTNALNIIFNPPKLAMKNITMAFTEMLPMWKNLLGGIILLGNNLEESKDNLILEGDYIPIATAGDAYSGSNVRRGSLNINETYETENGYHFTWDFATDKANGTISSIALTSRIFGNSGFTHAEDTNTGRLIINPLTFNSPATSFGTAPSIINKSGNLLVGSFEPLIYTYISVNYTSPTSTITLNKYKIPDPEALRINDRVWGSDSSNPEQPLKTVVYQSEWVFNEVRSTYVSVEEKVLYVFSSVTYQTYRQDGYTYIATVKYLKIDILTLELIEEGSISFPKTGGAQILSQAIHNGIYYAVTNGEGTYKVAPPETLMEILPYNTLNYGRFYVQDGALMCGLYEGAKFFFRRIDKSCDFLIDGAMGWISHAEGIELPYTLFSTTSEIFNTGYIALLSNYLATINNLSQPLTKTNAQTLKIAYDIIND